MLQSWSVKPFTILSSLFKLRLLSVTIWLATDSPPDGAPTGPRFERIERDACEAISYNWLNPSSITARDKNEGVTTASSRVQAVTRWQTKGECCLGYTGSVSQITLRLSRASHKLGKTHLEVIWILEALGKVTSRHYRAGANGHRAGDIASPASAALPVPPAPAALPAPPAAPQGVGQ